jgi:hypothetical protein
MRGEKIRLAWREVTDGAASKILEPKLRSFFALALLFSVL